MYFEYVCFDTLFYITNTLFYFQPSLQFCINFLQHVKETEKKEEPSTLIPIRHSTPPRSSRRKAFSSAPLKLDKSFKPRVISKTPEEVAQIRDVVRGNFLFASLDADQMELVIQAMERKSFNKGEWIIRQGDAGDEFYVVSSGVCKTFIKSSNGEEKMVKEYSRGGAFGELALMKNAPRAASIQAASDVVELWALDRDTFRHVVTSSALDKRNKYEHFLAQVPLLTGLEDYDRARLADSLKEHTFTAGMDIIVAGDSRDQNFYILLEGEAVALKRLSPTDTQETVVMRYKKGDYFGELALLRNTSRAATVRAMTDCSVVSIDRDSFERLLGPVHEILEREKERYDKVEKELKCSDEH